MAHCTPASSQKPCTQYLLNIYNRPKTITQNHEFELPLESLWQVQSGLIREFYLSASGDWLFQSLYKCGDYLEILPEITNLKAVHESTIIQISDKDISAVKVLEQLHRQQEFQHLLSLPKTQGDEGISIQRLVL